MPVRIAGSPRRLAGISILLAHAAAVNLFCPALQAQEPQGALLESHQKRGMAYLETHNFEGATIEFRLAVQADRFDPMPHDSLGVALAESGHVDQAVAEFEKAIALSDDFATANLHLAVAYDKLGRTSDAVAQYEQVLFLTPNQTDARYALSADCWKVGDKDGAIRALHQVAEQKPSYLAEVRSNLALELSQEGKYREAVEELQAAAALEPGSVKLYIRLCQALVQNQQLKEAVEAGHRAVRLAPESADAHYSRAEALRVSGDLSSAEG